MEKWVAVAILLEVLLMIAAVWCYLHEEKLIRIEHAFVKSVIWELLERFAKKDVERNM